AGSVPSKWDCRASLVKSGDLPLRASSRITLDENSREIAAVWCGSSAVLREDASIGCSANSNNFRPDEPKHLMKSGTSVVLMRTKLRLNCRLMMTRLDGQRSVSVYMQNPTSASIRTAVYALPRRVSELTACTLASAI